MSSHAAPVADSLPLPPWTTIAFSGHRSLADPDLIAAAIGRALDAIAKLRPQLAAVSSAASGSDTLFAEAAIGRAMPLTVVLPFAKDRFQRDFEKDAEGWRRAEAVMAAAVFVGEVERTESDVAAYMEAGVRTIDAADLLIAVWDGQPGRGEGGTADAVSYAEALNKPVLIIDSTTGQFDVESLARLGKAPATAERLTPADLADPRAVVRRLYDRANQKALEYGPKSRRIVFWYVCLHLIASAALVVKIGYPIHGTLAIVVSVFELAVLLAGTVWLVKWHHRRHQLWVSQRAVAEICRSFLNTWDIRRGTPSHPPKAPPLAYESLFATLRLLRHIDRSPQPTFGEARDAYERLRLANQIEYFTGQRDHAQKWIDRLRFLVLGATLLAVLSTVAAMVISWPHGSVEHASKTDHPISTTVEAAPPESHDKGLAVLEIFSALAPLISAAIGTIILTHEYARRAERYAELVEMMKRLQARLLASRTWDGLARVATQVEEELLQEVLEWQAFTRVTAHLH
jgi:hypothetical protein